MKTELIDQLGRTVSLNGTAKRIVSLVPSITEFLADLQLDNEVIGLTKFCIRPQSWFTAKTRVGGTKKINFETIHSLQPDLIIANKEENQQDQIEKLAALYNVYLSDVKTFEDMYTMMTDLGILCGRESISYNWVERSQTKVSTLIEKHKHFKKAVYLVWNDPIMVAGSDTFINSTLPLFGFENAVHHERYPKFTLPELEAIDFDVILLPTEPFPFKWNHKNFYQTKFLNKSVQLVDVELYSWYGSRIAKILRT